MAVEAKTAIGVTPGKLEFSTPAGKSITATITISNAGDESSTIRSYAMDYIKKPNGDVRFLPAGQSKWSCAKWIKVRPGKVDLNIGEAKKVNCSIKVPGNACPGHYWAVVLFETTAVKEKGVAVCGRVGSIFSLKVVSSQSNGGSKVSPWIYVLAGILLTAIIVFVLARKLVAKRRKEE
jgi:uncharacterized membrane protein